MTAEIICGDMLDLLPKWAIDGLQVDTIISDPPYHMGDMQKRFGKADSAPAKHGRDGAAGRLARGFMGSETDAGDISFRPDTWAACKAVLKPGGRLIVFGGSRTFWKMGAAIDAAGFICEDTIIWTYGQGLVLRKSRMKPCIEPIMVWRKPGPVADLNIEDCRVSGRWPGNLIHDGSVDVVNCFPASPGQLAKASSNPNSPRTKHVYGKLGQADDPMMPRGDDGSSARFFQCCEFDTREVHRLQYHAKASGKDKVFRCTVCEQDCSHSERVMHTHDRENLLHLRYHPTVKPLSLMRYLVRLFCPHDGVVLDPFCGTGSTCVAAVLENRDAIGIEKDSVYSGHARIRLSMVV